MPKKILIIAPHADDEILGCGGSIVKHKENKDIVYVLILTNASKGNRSKYSDKYIKIIRNEALEAHKYLNIDNTFFENLPAPQLDQFPLFKIADIIRDYLLNLKINTIYIPNYSDSHIDHKLIFEASLVSTRPFNGNMVKNIFAYETLSETEWSFPYQEYVFKPNYFNELSKRQLMNKINSFKFYKSQLKNKNHTRSAESIDLQAKFRGSSIGRKYAEAFFHLKEIND